MSGRLDPASPWARQAFTREERLEIEAALPDGIRVVVTCNGSHSRYTLEAYRSWATTERQPVSSFVDVRDPVAAARTMASVLSAEALTVTTDSLGYITSIEAHG
jgi:hypothetical protein